MLLKLLNRSSPLQNNSGTTHFYYQQTIAEFTGTEIKRSKIRVPTILPDGGDEALARVFDDAHPHVEGAVGGSGWIRFGGRVP